LDAGKGPLCGAGFVVGSEEILATRVRATCRDRASCPSTNPRALLFAQAKMTRKETNQLQQQRSPCHARQCCDVAKERRRADPPLKASSSSAVVHAGPDDATEQATFLWR
jgi:hypothetical protein